MLLYFSLKSFRDVLIVATGIPFGAVGGVLALRLLNLFVFTPVDLLTMIGFVILLGVVGSMTGLLIGYSPRRSNSSSGTCPPSLHARRCRVLGAVH